MSRGEGGNTTTTTTTTTTKTTTTIGSPETPGAQSSEKLLENDQRRSAYSMGLVQEQNSATTTAGNRGWEKNRMYSNISSASHYGLAVMMWSGADACACVITRKHTHAYTPIHTYTHPLSCT